MLIINMIIELKVSKCIYFNKSRKRILGPCEESKKLQERDFEAENKTKWKNVKDEKIRWWAEKNEKESEESRKDQKR
jgi:hypothetical protein